MSSVPDQLARIERYYDTVPRDNAATEAIGPFTLFVSTGGFPFYARPTLGGTGSFTVDDVLTVVERRRPWVCRLLSSGWTRSPRAFTAW